MSIEDRYRRTREAIRKASKANIVVTRDLLEKAFPGFLKKGDGLAVVPADPPRAPSDVEDEGASTVDAYPPQWAMEAQEEDGEDMDRDELVFAIEDQLPLKADVDVWELMRVPGAHSSLVELLNGDLPEDVERTTSTPKYVNHVMAKLFSDTYMEEHMIPDKSAQPPGGEGEKSPVLPAVPKKILAALQTLVLRYTCVDFDGNTFWAQVREHFPDVCNVEHVDKPSGNCLLQQALATVSMEDQAAKAARNLKAYANYIRYMQEYKSGSSSEEESPDAPPGESQEPPPDSQQEVADLSLGGAALDTTLGQAVYEQHRSTSTSYVLRKRTYGGEDSGPSKKAKEDEKKDKM